MLSTALTALAADDRFQVGGYAPDYRLNALDIQSLAPNLTTLILFSIEPELHGGGKGGNSDGGSGKGNPAAQSEKGSGAGNASGGSGDGSGDGSDGGGQTQTLKASNKDGPQSQKTEPGAPAAAAQVNKGSTPQGNSGAAPTQAELEPGVDKELKLKHTRQGSGSGGEGGASGGEGNGSDDGEERPNSMERASSGDGSNDGANQQVDEPGRKGKPASARDDPATSKPPPKEDKKTKRTGKSTK